MEDFDGIPPRVWNIGAPHPPDAVYIGRGSKRYGNRFVIGRDGDRGEVCDKFEREQLPDMDVSALRGAHLLCHCAPARCHGDSILKKANAPEASAVPAVAPLLKEDVRECLRCGCKTWHVNGVCEWSDGHKF